MNKYDTYFLNKSISYEGKLVAVTGATGTLGFYIAHYLLLKNAKLIIIGRNEKKLLKTKEDLLKNFKDAQIDYLICDFSKIDELISLSHKLEELKIDYLFNNAGTYYLPVKIQDEHDVTFTTNFISPIYLTKYLCEKLPNLTVVQTGSISYRFTKLKLSDLERIKSPKIKRYGSSKRLLTISTFKLQTMLDNPIYIAHPGVTATSLFSSSKGGFSKAFGVCIVPIMKLIFMNPHKAALSMALAPSYPYKKETQIGPRGIFQIWGYPKERKLPFKHFKTKEKDNIDDIISKNINF